MRADSRRPETLTQWRALIAALGQLRRGHYPGGPLDPATDVPRLLELFWVLCRGCGARDTLILVDDSGYRLHCPHCAVYERI